MPTETDHSLHPGDPLSRTRWTLAEGRSSRHKRDLITNLVAAMRVESLDIISLRIFYISLRLWHIMLN